MKGFTVLLLSLALAMPLRAHAGHWVVEETDTRFFVEYIPDLTDEVPGPTWPVGGEQTPKSFAPSNPPSKDTVAGQPYRPFPPSDPKVAEAQKQYLERRIEEREARRQEREAQRIEKEARRLEREARRSNEM